MTNKTATASALLVAAVPAAALGFFLVQSFLTELGRLNTTFLGLYGVTLAACVGVIFLPFGVLIFGAKSAPRKAARETGSQDVPPEKVPETGEMPAQDEFDKSTPEVDTMGMEEGTMEEAGEAPTSTGELEIVEPTESEAEMAAFDDFDSGEPETEAFASDDDEFRFDDEEEPPKKKKK